MPAPEPTPDEDPAHVPRRATLREVAGAVFWSFFGIRKGDAMRRDAVTIKPVQVIIAGIIGAVIFVLSLVMLVRFITS